jgi:NAD(P)H-flavin reductase
MNEIKPRTHEGGKMSEEIFNHRLPDLFIEKIIPMGNGFFQVEGRNTDGEKVWIQVIMRQPLIVQPPEVD